MEKNDTLLQAFEWYLPDDSQHWNKLKVLAPSFSNLGVTLVWLPPAYKGAGGVHDVGYGVYDLYDLGEFDQKGTIPTKYGTKQEYLDAIDALQKENISVLADIVLNQKMGGDTEETIDVIKSDPNNRNEEIGGDYQITAWTKFTFPNRKGKYSTFTWNASYFDGTDWDEKKKQSAVYLIEGKNWDSNVDSEHGNFDYLMGCDIDFKNQEVLQEFNRWGKWYLDTTGINGMRLDAVKHIDNQFFKNWLSDMRAYKGNNFFAVGEYWNGDLGKLQEYLADASDCMSLFDVPLHYQLLNASDTNGNFDMRQLFQGTLVENDPWHAVTFVDNHDTEPGQSLESFVLSWFKPLAYALILLRIDGLPCVFYGDLYGIPAKNVPAVAELPTLMKIRELYAYGEQHDYFDNPDIIGWTRSGSDEFSGSGLAVVLSNRCGGSKRMYIGTNHSGKEFRDILGNCINTVMIDEDGCGEFSCTDGSVSVWLEKTLEVKVSLD